jgi:hypothetical protein
MHTILFLAQSLALAGLLFAAGVGLVALISLISDRNR